MVTTRSHDDDKPAASTGDKRHAAEGGSSPKRKKVVAKKDEEDGGDEDEQHKKPTSKGGKGKHVQKKVVKHEEQHEEKGEEKKDEGRRPAGMSEDKKHEEPKGDIVEGNAQPGQVPAHLPEPDAERKHGIIEKGHVYFIYRPKVEIDHPESLDDVQRFHLLVVPHGSKLHRLIAIGKKALPDASESTRPIWGQVVNVGEDMKALKEGLGPKTYETKTRGTRHQAGARVAASGAYVLYTVENYPKDSANESAVYHTYFAYEIAVPHEMGEVQEALHIQHEGAFTLQVKNPEAPSTNPAVGNQPASKHPQFPPEYKKLFHTKFIPASPPELLDYPGAELLLIPSKHEAVQDIGEKAEKELDKEEKELEKSIEGQKDGGEAKKALKEMGLEGLIDGKALEGHWE
ncbi:hypothetical protein NBRC10512_000957 [Rhodotorula toruloides]|uniref:RHTO0S06e05028g1_1 n=2 Tax=Rhodotorula toruloides TaxID=5286 RepID=A0A061B3Y3_RHOTO|nr:uncharacterized protein RHTO_06211 [Rhodotorula toruloides NP11]EMS24207.1 hypothetical protein RHTO_06211 [Rhodotorula toruloides NP11]CDR41728.1 RHTO0S06e05028g1_1 [Rhodotorula toruloides]